MYITFLIYDGLRERAPPQLEHWGDHVGDSLLTLHCHYLAITLPLHCHYIAITLPLPCHYLAITLPLYCHYIAIILPLHCNYIVITLPLHWHLHYITLHYSSSTGATTSAIRCCCSTPTGAAGSTSTRHALALTIMTWRVRISPASQPRV